MKRPIYSPLLKAIVGVVYGLALTSALATLVGAIHPLAGEERSQNRLVHASHTEQVPASQHVVRRTGDTRRAGDPAH